jgi:hypothetical protein
MNNDDRVLIRFIDESSQTTITDSATVVSVSLKFNEVTVKLDHPTEVAELEEMDDDIPLRTFPIKNVTLLSNVEDLGPQPNRIDDGGESVPIIA